MRLGGAAHLAGRRPLRSVGAGARFVVRGGRLGASHAGTGVVCLRSVFMAPWSRGWIERAGRSVVAAAAAAEDALRFAHGTRGEKRDVYSSTSPTCDDLIDGHRQLYM